MEVLVLFCIGLGGWATLQVSWSATLGPSPGWCHRCNRYDTGSLVRRLTTTAA